MTACIALERGLRCARAATTGAVFCDVHVKAPAGQRGGWISAWKRKVAMARPTPASEPYTDFSNISPPGSSMKLYVGAAPPLEQDLQFDVIVLCAAEIQTPPLRMGYRGTIVKCPLPDDALTRDQIRSALAASSHVAMHIAQKRRVLVTCQMGLNRSALVASLTLARLTRMSSDDIVAHVRSRRHPKCLFNAHFREYLRRFVQGTEQQRRRG